MWETCPECGNEFFQDEPWKKICLDCWKAKKARQNSFSLDRDQQKIQILEYALKRSQCRVAELECQLEEVNPPQEFIMNLKSIIALCHPDKHGGSRIANKITAYLNNIRDEITNNGVY